MMFKKSLLFLLLTYVLTAAAQNTVNDPDAGALLQKVSDYYKSQKSIQSNFQLLIQRPKARPEEDERKLSDTVAGSILLSGPKFKIIVKDQQIICDGKNIWTYFAKDKEVQVNYFEETEDMLSPSKIFSLYKDGYSYMIKEKKTVGGKAVTVIEMSPVNKKASFFKVDVSIDEAANQITESKIYEKNGVRYIYKLSKQVFSTPVSDDTFTFDAKKYPGINVVDLR